MAYPIVMQRYCFRDCPHKGIYKGDTVCYNTEVHNTFSRFFIRYWYGRYQADNERNYPALMNYSDARGIPLQSTYPLEQLLGFAAENDRIWASACPIRENEIQEQAAAEKRLQEQAEEAARRDEEIRLAAEKAARDEEARRLEAQQQDAQDREQQAAQALAAQREAAERKAEELRKIEAEATARDEREAAERDRLAAQAAADERARIDKLKRQTELEVKEKAPYNSPSGSNSSDDEAVTTEPHKRWPWSKK